MSWQNNILLTITGCVAFAFIVLLILNWKNIKSAIILDLLFSLEQRKNQPKRNQNPKHNLCHVPAFTCHYWFLYVCKHINKEDKQAYQKHYKNVFVDGDRQWGMNNVFYKNDHSDSNEQMQHELLETVIHSHKSTTEETQLTIDCHKVNKSR